MCDGVTEADTLGWCSGAKEALIRFNPGLMWFGLTSRRLTASKSLVFVCDASKRFSSEGAGPAVLQRFLVPVLQPVVLGRHREEKSL